MKPQERTLSRMSPATGGREHRGFTLIEMLVVVTIILLLIALVIPGISGARNASRLAACNSNLHQIGIALQAYAQSNNKHIPQGPGTAILPWYAEPLMVTNQVQAADTSSSSPIPVGIGLLLAGYLDNPQVVFCPGDDILEDVTEELAKVNTNQDMFCSYYYRHGSTHPTDPPAQTKNLIFDLGKNNDPAAPTPNDAPPATALLLDRNFLAPGTPDQQRTNHENASVVILKLDGGCVTRPNKLEEDPPGSSVYRYRYSVYLDSNPDLMIARLNEIFRRADRP